jgi:AraC family transcriptional regulator, arabinose operon regulatory protein
MHNVIFPLITEYELKLPYSIIGVGCFYNQEHVIRPNGYPYYQWLQCHHGKGELIINGLTYHIDENQGILLYPDVQHEYYALSNTWEVDWIIFSGLYIEDFFNRTAEIKKSGVYFVSQPDIILTKIRKALSIELSDNPMKSLECSRIAYDILVDILKSSSLKSDNSIDYQFTRLKPLFDFIESYHSKALNLSELSEVVGVTPQHLCVLFKRITNVRVFEYINFVRIKKSKEYLLQNRTMQIKEIASLSGFEDVSYFCSIFKKIEHVSPNEFRKLHSYA